MKKPPTTSYRTEPHPEAVKAMRDRIERHVDGCCVDEDALAYDLAKHVLNLDQRARQHGKGQVKELREKLLHARGLAGTKPEQPTEARLMRTIAGQIQSAINEHGPVTPENKSSAAKRVMCDLTRRRWIRLGEV